jgi:regulator of protease activity HflC (stomatin/prohibitin superfamily)
MSELSRYRMSDLFPKGDTPSKLPELEAAILQTLRSGSQEGGRSLKDDGIEAVNIGIDRIKFPEETTKAVFQRMESDRKRLIDQLESQGQSEAQTIRTGAESLAKTIRAFATTAAVEIRSKGDVEAAPWLTKMQENPELAVFLRNLQFMRTAISRKTTLILPTTTPGIDLFALDALNGLNPGEIPGNFSNGKKPPAPRAGEAPPDAPGDPGAGARTGPAEGGR